MDVWKRQLSNAPEPSRRDEDRGREGPAPEHDSGLFRSARHQGGHSMLSESADGARWARYAPVQWVHRGGWDDPPCDVGWFVPWETWVHCWPLTSTADGRAAAIQPSECERQGAFGGWGGFGVEVLSILCYWKAGPHNPTDPPCYLAGGHAVHAALLWAHLGWRLHIEIPGGQGVGEIYFWNTMCGWLDEICESSKTTTYGFSSDFGWNSLGTGGFGAWFRSFLFWIPQFGGLGELIPMQTKSLHQGREIPSITSSAVFKNLAAEQPEQMHHALALAAEALCKNWENWNEPVPAPCNHWTCGVWVDVHSSCFMIFIVLIRNWAVAQLSAPFRYWMKRRRRWAMAVSWILTGAFPTETRPSLRTSSSPKMATLLLKLQKARSDPQSWD